MVLRTIEKVDIRVPFFSGWDTTKANYVYNCPHCKNELHIAFSAMLNAAWGWKEDDTIQPKYQIANHFGINLENKSIGTGMDAVVLCICSHCQERSIIDFWFNEYRNSCYEISLKGMATLEGE